MKAARETQVNGQRSHRASDIADFVRIAAKEVDPDEAARQAVKRIFQAVRERRKMDADKLGVHP
jgi:hypothetical protein